MKNLNRSGMSIISLIVALLVIILIVVLAIFFSLINIIISFVTSKVGLCWIGIAAIFLIAREVFGD